jgi:uncharacterized membrane protein
MATAERLAAFSDAVIAVIMTLTCGSSGLRRCD